VTWLWRYTPNHRIRRAVGKNLRFGGDAPIVLIVTVYIFRTFGHCREVGGPCINLDGLVWNFNADWRSMCQFGQLELEFHHSGVWILIWTGGPCVTSDGPGLNFEFD